MKKNLFLLAAIFMLMMVIAACGSQSTTGGNAGEAPSEPAAEEPTEVEEEASEIVVTHRLGETPVSVNPETVVVFDFGVLDTLDKLGVEVTGVPQANIPPYLAKYEDAKYENVGSLKEPDFEKIAELNPGLIIISGRQQEAYEELSKIGPTVFIGLDTADYMASFTNNMELIGKIFNKEEAIAEELAALNEAITALQEKASATDKNALVILSNEGNISAYGPSSRFGIIHDVFGLAPVDENIEVSTHGMNVSFEYIVEKDPDYLFVVDRNAVVAGEAGAQDTIENELVQNTKAYQNGNIIYLDPNYWYLSGGGLVSVSEMVKAIEAVIE